MSELILDPQTTALVLIDLQKGIVPLAAGPHSGADVVTRSVRLIEAFRRKKAPVVLVHVGFLDGKDALAPQADAVSHSASSFPAGWDEFVPEIVPQPGDILIKKRQWSAFTGTELDLQLRRRGIKTIVLAGIATHIGVESTARIAYELGYEQVFVEDATSSLSAEAHAASMKFIFPRMGRIRTTSEVEQAFS
ncbi:MAG: hydrolase [Verrucomicrobium sp.]|nr:hydrolase [Verrucomicrobium sp.]